MTGFSVILNIYKAHCSASWPIVSVLIKYDTF